MSDDEFYKMTFSQREGKAPLPEPMRLEHVSKRFRNRIWRFVDNAVTARLHQTLLVTKDITYRGS